MKLSKGRFPAVANRAALVVVIFVGALATADAQAPTQGVRILGSGAAGTCGSWTADRRSGAWFGKGNWALGFLSGAAFALNRELLSGVDSDGLLGWLDNYCQGRPLEPFNGAVIRLVEERQRR